MIFDIRRVNFPILLLSFVLSVLLWMHVKTLAASTEVRVGPSSFSVRLTPKNQPPGMVIVTPLPSNVTFTALGSVDQQRKIDAADLKAYVDLSERPKDGRYRVVLETTGDYKVEWRPANMRIPIVLEEEVTKSIKVEVEASGLFDLNEYRYDGATSDPATITIKGAKSLVSKVKRARAYLNLADLKSSNEQDADVQVLDDKDLPVTSVSLSTNVVKVRAFIAPKPPRRSLLIQPVWNGTPDFGSTIADYQFTPAQVSVEGPADVLANLSIINTKPINIDGINQTTTISVELDLPQGIRLTKPETITVKVFVKSSGTSPNTTTGGQ